MRPQQPKLIVPPDTTDKLFEALSIAGIFFTLIILGIYYQRLPQEIPIHFDAQGNINNFAGKSTILFLPVFGIISFIGFKLLYKYPHTFNYPFKITKANAAYMYKQTLQMLRFTNVVIVWLFAYIVWSTILIGLNRIDAPSMLVVFSILGCLFLSFAYYMWKMYNYKQELKDNRIVT